MPIAHDIPGMVFKNGSAVLLARIVGAAGEPVTQADISAICYTISVLDENDINAETPVTGHVAQSLDVGESIFDTLVRDNLWDADAVGYDYENFDSLASAATIDPDGSIAQSAYVLFTYEADRCPVAAGATTTTTAAG